jgi:glycosyltransferase involved in cell wall biosynthesis
VRCQARVLANVGAAELKRAYERAKIFWHATGYGEDDLRRPDLAEHFGMATAEAMAAGCVPIVINRGGQREIVEHGVNGFLWDTVEELKEYTLRLTHDDRLLTRMSESARRRAQCFSRENFLRPFLALTERLMR